MKEDIYKALLLIRENDWHAAHEIAQSNEGHIDYDRIHAFLHRIEGDDWNAKYWYRRIGLPFPEISTEQELKLLIEIYKM